MAEPRPDIHELFCYYNSLYFSEALGTCILSWAPCLTSMPASCDCIEEGLCEIQLSVPLLKSRSSTDLKNILLHEMIHAFLWIIHKNNNHSEHGSKFWNIANLINSNHKDDDQRPSNGYHITARHGFQNEENTHDAHLWMCTSCGDFNKGGMNGEPSPSGCLENNGGDDCGNILCGWHRHKKLCPGQYEKVVDVSAFKNKGKSIGVQANERDNQTDLPRFDRQYRQRLLPAEEIKDKRVIKRPRIMSEYLSSITNKPRSSGKKSAQPDCSNNSNQLLVMDLKDRSLAAGPEIPRQRRTSCKKICNLPDREENTNHKRRREITLVIQLFGVYTDEESEEDPDPLINKRSERRKRMKLCNNSDGRGEQTAGFTPYEVISLD
ncbi:hypothetical protein KFK09_004238 [Dendrobium nobile]|uniref:SprT-like domain-containing protein n=1 Tax=Dendrobium nobile TaxID=94219 RepID=A0A8T3C003_DENNO|nr:hypothetical protein KFK09_004238 [Dendrobium nobile]